VRPGSVGARPPNAVGAAPTLQYNVDAVSDRAIELAVRAAAPVESAWSAWTDPARLCEWFPDRASGCARAGDAMTYEWDALGMSLDLQVVDARPHKRLVLRGNPTGRAVETQTLSFARDGDGCAIALRHTGMPDDDVAAGTESGWRVTLAVLRYYLEHCYATPRASAWMLGFAPAGFASAFHYYTEPDGLATWLADGGRGVGQVGDAYALALPGGASMSGEVIARCAPREVAMTWSEIGGVVAFRLFRIAAGATLVGAHAMTWGRSADDVAPELNQLRIAVDRLVSALGGTSALA